MPRLVVNPIQTVRNASVVLAYTALVAADDASVRVENGSKAVVIVNGHATLATTVTFKAGTGVQSWLSPAGDVAFTVAATQTRVFGPFDSAQFENADGTLFIDVDQAVNIAVLQLQ